MGLDISVYGQIEYIRHCDINQHEEKWVADRDVFYVYEVRDYRERAPELKFGAEYRFKSSENFRAGSYSGYNWWRNQLSEFSMGVDAKTVWHNPEIYKDKPFYELINFSDCEGYIGTAICKKLAADFSEWQEAIDNLTANTDDLTWFKSQYAYWRKAFELASNDGVVVFH